MARKQWIERHGHLLAQVIADHDGWKDELATIESLLHTASAAFGAKLHRVQTYPAMGLTTSFYTTNPRLYVQLYPHMAYYHAKER